MQQNQGLTIYKMLSGASHADRFGPANVRRSCQRLLQNKYWQLNTDL